MSTQLRLTVCLLKPGGKWLVSRSHVLRIRLPSSARSACPGRSPGTRCRSDRGFDGWQSGSHQGEGRVSQHALRVRTCEPPPSASRMDRGRNQSDRQMNGHPVNAIPKPEVTLVHGSQVDRVLNRRCALTTPPPRSPVMAVAGNNRVRSNNISNREDEAVLHDPLFLSRTVSRFAQAIPPVLSRLNYWRN
jgi:hypothetical protein